MSNPENRSLQGRFEIDGGVLKEGVRVKPWAVTREGEPVQLFTDLNRLSTEIDVEFGYLTELGREVDAGKDIGNQYSEVVNRLRKKLILENSLRPKK